MDYNVFMEISPQYFNCINKPAGHYIGLGDSQKPYHFLDDITFESKPVEVSKGFFIDYGITHFTAQGKPADGMEESRYTPMKSPKWAINRPRFNPPFPRPPSTGNLIPPMLMKEPSLDRILNQPHKEWEAPTRDQFWNMVITARKFLTVSGYDNTRRFDQQPEDRFLDNKEDCLEARKNLLVNLLGFEDTGVSVGGDLQFIYQFSSEWSQVEIYLSTEDSGDFREDSGEVTELYLYNHARNVEIRFPIRSMESFMYLFFQVFGDIYSLDFNKLKLLEEDEYFINKFKSTYDFIHISTTDFIKYIMDGGCILKLVYNYPK